MTLVELAAQVVATALGAAAVALPAFRRVVSAAVAAEVRQMAATLPPECPLAGACRPSPAPRGATTPEA